MSEQCNWRIAHGIGWLVCQRERGHDPEKFPHVHATKVGEQQVEGTWEEGPTIFAPGSFVVDNILWNPKSS